jgi:sarcosine oxidase subunit gamma
MPDASVNRSFVSITPTEWLAPQPPLARWVLRGGPLVREIAGRVFGVLLPQLPCRAVERGSRAGLWLGPDEWLLLAPDGEGDAIAPTLADALQAQPHSLVDVSHRQVGFEVLGPRAEWLLGAQCPLPLHLRDFPVGMCTRTVFARTQVVLWRVAEHRFHVEAARSYASYLVELLHEVAREPDYA